MFLTYFVQLGKVQFINNIFILSTKNNIDKTEIIKLKQVISIIYLQLYNCAKFENVHSKD